VPRVPPDGIHLRIGTIELTTDPGISRQQTIIDLATVADWSVEPELRSASPVVDALPVRDSRSAVQGVEDGVAAGTAVIVDADVGRVTSPKHVVRRRARLGIRGDATGLESVRCSRDSRRERQGGGETDQGGGDGQEGVLCERHGG